MNDTVVSDEYCQLKIDEVIDKTVPIGAKTEK